MLMMSLGLLTMLLVWCYDVDDATGVGVDAIDVTSVTVVTVCRLQQQRE